MSASNRHRELVQNLLDNKAVDFAAIGRVLGEVGPSLALNYEDGDHFCGTMRTFVHVYKLPVGGLEVADLARLAAAAPELQR